MSGIMLPQLGEGRTQREMISVFRGLNQTQMPMPDEWYDMRNMTGAQYPALAPRGERTMLRRLERPNGLFARGKLCWVDGTDFYYDGVVRGQVEDSRKQFVAMGAYVLIWPDKCYYNTETEEYGSLQARRETEGTVGFTLCRADGSAYEDYQTGPVAPVGAEDGDLWVNTAVMPNVLQQYSAVRGMWISMPTTYVKITAPGIGAGFATYDGVTLSGCEEQALNGDVILYGASEDMILVVGVLGAAHEQEAPVSVERTAPDMDYLTECGNRVWGCSSAAHEIYACKLGDPTNWRCYMGVSTDSYAATIGTAGDFTGACTHLGYVLFFKEDVIHKLYGNKPANYQIMDVSARGVQRGSERSLVVVNETLYYKSRGGVCAYGAALPQDISAALGPGSRRDAVAGALGDKYYVSMGGANSEISRHDGTWGLYAYDEAKGIWHREDETQAVDLVALDGTLYCLRADGWLLTLDGPAGPYGGEEARLEDRVDWMVETGDLGTASPDHKYISKLQLRLTVAEDALVRILARYDYGGDFEEVLRINPGRKRSVTVPVIPRRCDTMRLRLEGYGGVVLHSICRTTEEGSEMG